MNEIKVSIQYGASVISTCYQYISHVFVVVAVFAFAITSRTIYLNAFNKVHKRLIFETKKIGWKIGSSSRVVVGHGAQSRPKKN